MMRFDDANVAPVDGHRIVRLLIAGLVCLNVAVFAAKQIPWKAWL